MMKKYFILHIMFLLLSLAGIFGKLSSYEEFLSLPYVLYIAGIFLVLFAYAVGWQQILKKLPLSVAYVNKSVCLVWALIWGWMFFDEIITMGKLAGIILIIIGTVIYTLPEGGQRNE